jgi:tRNA-binding EMAP/Myf-like protein
MFGETSNGMLLAAETEAGELALLTTDKPISNGARVT